MAASPSSTITEHFANLTDPRIDHTKRHQLLDILTIALCALICGADAWVAMEEFGNAKREWFDTFLTLPNVSPSHDTFGRVFAALDPDQFQHCFLSWMQQTMTQTDGEVIACDGKTVRRSHDRGRARRRSTWSAPGRARIGWSSAKSRSMRKAMKSPPCLRCASC